MKENNMRKCKANIEWYLHNMGYKATKEIELPQELLVDGPTQQRLKIGNHTVTYRVIAFDVSSGIYELNVTVPHPDPSVLIEELKKEGGWSIQKQVWVDDE